MGPISLRMSDQHELTGHLLNTIDYHPASPRIPGAPFCLGETPDLRDTLFNKLDIRYSFHHIVKAEYGGQQQLHMAAQNYRLNRSRDTTLPDPHRLIPYEKAFLQPGRLDVRPLHRRLRGAIHPGSDTGQSSPGNVFRWRRVWAGITGSSNEARPGTGRLRHP